jgi:hypothetical protein
MKIKFWGIEFEIFDAGCREKVKYNHWDTALEAAQKMNRKPTTRRCLVRSWSRGLRAE